MSHTDRRLIAFARRMRHEPTPAEGIMWRLLRDRRLAGFRFRRQHPVPPYIADYYCATARLVIELDGETHVGNDTADRARQACLEDQGLRVLRFLNWHVYEESEMVLDAVYRACVDGMRANPKVRHKLNAVDQFAP